MFPRDHKESFAFCKDSKDLCLVRFFLLGFGCLKGSGRELDGQALPVSGEERFAKGKVQVNGAWVLAHALGMSKVYGLG
jgi:hypothetical protein